MTYYKKCKVKHKKGLPCFTKTNLLGMSEHQWRNYLARELLLDLSKYDLKFSDIVVPDDTLVSVPRRIK